MPRRALVASLPLWLGLAAAARAQQSAPYSRPIRVTSDSRQYCAQLADTLEREVQAYPPEPDLEAVRVLGRDGERMCREGHVRPGILRIRKALLMLRDRNRMRWAHPAP